MAKKKRKTYLPLTILQLFRNEFPDIWDYLDEVHSDNGKQLPAWPSWCYIPCDILYIDLSNALIPDETKTTLQEHVVSLTALASWRKSKEVFVIDTELQELLTKDADENTNLPSAALLNLPFNCFYIETPGYVFEEKNVHGVFVSQEYQISTHERVIVLIILFSDMDMTYQIIPIHINSKTLLENQEYGYKLCTSALTSEFGSEYADQVMADFKKHNSDVNSLHETSKLLQLVLYLCSDKPDITKHAEQKYYRPSATIKDAFREVRKWDTGVRIGARYRKYKESAGRNVHPTITCGGKGTSKRPHPRRAHWHHYWVGPKSDLSKRHLVLKWLAPTFINLDELDEELPAVLRKVC